MNNKKYGLNISDEYVEFFQKFLGYGDPLNSKIWFIGNEEAFDIGEGPLEKIEKIKKGGDNIFSEQRYFTKKFSEINGIGCNWPGYINMKRDYESDLDKVFISEIFFLPSDDEQGLEITYLGKGLPIYEYTEIDGKVKEYKTRKDFYQRNNLEDLLKKRILFLKSIFEEQVENIHIYIYGKSSYKIKLLEKYLGKKEGKDKWMIGTNSFSLIEFNNLSNKKFLYSDKKEEENLLNKGYFPYGEDKCELCCGKLVQFISDDFHNITIIKCVNPECDYLC